MMFTDKKMANLISMFVDLYATLHYAFLVQYQCNQYYIYFVYDPRKSCFDNNDNMIVLLLFNNTTIHYNNIRTYNALVSKYVIKFVEYSV